MVMPYLNLKIAYNAGKRASFRIKCLANVLKMRKRKEKMEGEKLATRFESLKRADARARLP
jgi:hypothetical protein